LFSLIAAQYIPKVPSPGNETILFDTKNI